MNRGVYGVSGSGSDRQARALPGEGRRRQQPLQMTATRSRKTSSRMFPAEPAELRSLMGRRGTDGGTSSSEEGCSYCSFIVESRRRSIIVQQRKNLICLCRRELISSSRGEDETVVPCGLASSDKQCKHRGQHSRLPPITETKGKCFIATSGLCAIKKQTEPL